MMNNHDRPLSDLSVQLDKIRAAGFFPIGASQMYTYDVFIFEEPDEAEAAYKKLETDADAPISAFWYSREGWAEAVEHYEDEYCQVLTHWINPTTHD
ncbi:hypothetical protein LEM8419_03581 [Neolewinella maritima]|uniref:NIPSNAP domain-containing protein n=1 Tax=Neolewinella maritima TaxID=1383882 RepID=A0ABN8F6Y4_9BACT|nr:hypothetical protein [Neolewinella maritima]CAH1002709.1 hypothetical protein LEM8419_03581 [Neolewinella maritima]